MTLGMREQKTCKMTVNKQQQQIKMSRERAVEGLRTESQRPS